MTTTLGTDEAEPDLAILSGPVRRAAPPAWRTWIAAHRAALGRARLVAIGGASGVVAIVVFGLWFRTGSFYARGDLDPFVRAGLRSELGGQWTHQLTGAGGPTYEVVRLVEIVFTDLAHLLGGGDALGQRLLFAAIFAFAASGGAACAARLVERAWLVFLAGILGAFSPLTMVNLPNFLVPVCIGFVAWSGALTIDAARGDRTRRRVFAALTLCVAYVALNPPLLAVALAWVVALPAFAAACSGTGRAGARRAFVFLAGAGAWALPLAAWWLVPYAFAMRHAARTGAINANTDVVSWSWTHAHGSLDRVLALVAKWSWPDPRFAANASVLARPGWLWLAVLVPAGLAAAPLVARADRRRAGAWLAVIVLTLAFVAKGLNPPARGVNALLYRLPGAWLLREPMSKIGAVMVPLALLGWVLTVDGVVARSRTRLRRAALALLVVAPMLFAFPMLTGTVVRGSDRVHVPAAWHEVARIVDDAPLPGKALVLPLDDFYQVPTTWGFYGTDKLPVQLITRPTIVHNPQSYISGAGDFDQLVQAVQTGIVGGDPSSVPGVLRALGVSYLVVRSDIDHASPVRPVDMPFPEALTAGLDAVPGARRIARTAVADVFEFAPGGSPVEALSGTIAAPREHGAALATLVAGAPPGTAITTTDPAQAPLLRGQAWYVDVNALDGRIEPPAAGEWQYQRRAAGPPLLALQPDPRGLRLHEAVTIKVGGTVLANRPDEVVAGTGPAVAADVDGRSYDLTHGKVYARVTPGSTVTTYSRGASSRLGAWTDLGDCNRYDDLDPAAAELGASILATGGGQELRLRAARHSACLSAPIVGVAPGGLVRVSLDQRAVAGAPPRTCLWEDARDACVDLTWSTTRTGEWFTLTALHRAPVRDARMRLFLYADEPAAGGAATQVWYRRVGVDELVPSAPRVVQPAPLPSGRVHLDTRAVDVVATFAHSRPEIGPRGPVGDCNRTDGRSRAQLGIGGVATTTDPTAVVLSARDHVACVAFPLLGVAPEVTYELSVDAHVERGAAPRVCVWHDARQQCARFTAEPAPSGGSGIFRYRGRLDATEASSAVRLYLYADATSEPTTIAYRDVQIRPVTDESLVLRPAAVKVVPAPLIDWEQAGKAQYRVQVRDAKGPFVLALADAFSPKWRVRGLPAGARAEQIEVDGYRNGWVIDARGDLALTIEYAPARVGRAAMRVSFLTAVVLCVSLLFGARAARFRRRFLARRARARQPGPRRIVLPDAWPAPGA